ncbi:triacylglycerol lipase 2-like [Pyrus ussuriensis x Pyrus communis]|uniref:Lipase n=1 Tax=Pyrus ussuriensis x Pyrus communis TaxID=2448454 RepID=A0A5N5GJU3_9ROSA|nr:triacylglycerol lipase 2-like [Pyrus ussuriensis x Pyrus communis]
MENPSTIILVVALLWVSVVAATRTKLQSIENVDGGICKSMLETQGYTCQEHKVTTEDGYIIGLQRIPKGRSGDETPNKKPVLLQHGLLMDASAWLLNPPDQALAFILADNGFDVWLANTRATKSSRGHTSLTPNDPAYWDWSWDELAAYDLPALFKYVNNQTGQNLHYVGHSLGTLTALAAFSQEKLLNLLRSAALLAPIAYLGQMSSLFIRILMDLFLSETQELVEFICKTPGVDCSDLLATITGPNCCLSSASKAALFKNFPQSTATKNMIHLSQMVRMGTLEMYNYGNEDTNMEHYKQPTPPVYNMANIPKDVPLFLSYGGRDALSDVNDVGLLLDNVKDHDKDKLVVEYIEDYAHMDFIMSANANQLVYDPLLAFFKLH